MESKYSLFDFIRSSEHKEAKKLRELFRGIKSEDVNDLRKSAEKIYSKLGDS